MKSTYEDAVADLEGVARGCSAFWNWIGTRPASNSTGRAGPSRPPARSQVRKPLYRGSVGRWKLYRDELAELFARVEDQAGIRSERHVAV